MTPREARRKYGRVGAACLAAVALFIAGVIAQATTDRGPQHPGRPTTHAQHVTVFAWNEKSFPTMPAAFYRSDFAKVLPLGGKHTVFLHSEMSAPVEVTLFKQAAKAHGLQAHGVRKNGDTAISSRGLPRMRTKRIQVADKPAGPASPPRWLTITAEHVLRVVFIALHLSNGCFAKNAHKPWYAARCRALAQQIRLMRKVVARLVKAGFGVVIGGDLNVRRRIVWHAGQDTATGGGMVQLAAIPAEHVDVSLTPARSVSLRLHTDHRIVRSDLTVSTR